MKQVVGADTDAGGLICLALDTLKLNRSPKKNLDRPFFVRLVQGKLQAVGVVQDFLYGTIKGMRVQIEESGAVHVLLTVSVEAMAVSSEVAAVVGRYRPHTHPLGSAHRWCLRLKNGDEFDCMYLALL